MLDFNNKFLYHKVLRDNEQKETPNMEKLIYYPTFEPSSMNWIKYSLLYLDKFSPIIPSTGDDQLSDVFRKIQSETDIVHPFRPSWEDGNDASIKVMNEMDTILAHPERYRDIFNRVNIGRVFKDSKQWNFKLYEEKYSMEFVHFCRDNSLGKEVEGGMLLSEELAHFFMTQLADVVAYKTGAAPITDLKKLDRMISHFRMKGHPEAEFIDTAQATIKLKLPANIEAIGVDKIINFRNRPDFSEMRQAFTRTLNSFLESVECTESSPDKFINSLNKCNTALAKEMLLFFGGLTAISIGATILLNSNDPSSLEIIKQGIEGTIFLAGGGFAMNESWLADKEKRNARKYLTQISKMTIK